MWRMPQSAARVASATARFGSTPFLGRCGSESGRLIRKQQKLPNEPELLHLKYTLKMPYINSLCKLTCRNSLHFSGQNEPILEENEPKFVGGGVGFWGRNVETKPFPIRFSISKPILMAAGRGFSYACIRFFELRFGEIPGKSVLGAVTRLRARQSIT